MPVGGSSTVVGLEFENPANEEMREKEEELEENVFDAETKSRAGLNTLTREVTVDIEKEMHEAESCVIHPRQRWFIMWTTLNILVMVFMTFELPYRIAFVPYTEEMSSDEYKEQLGWREIADRTVDIILMVEHCFSYFIAYYDEDEETGLTALVTQKRYIAQNFFAGITTADRVNKGGSRCPMPSFNWIIQVLSCMPFDTVIFYFWDVRTSFFVRLVLRMGRVQEIFELRPAWNYFLTILTTVVPAVKDFTVLITLTAALGCFTHWTACTLFFVGRPVFDANDCADRGTCGWVSGIPQDTPVNQQYIISFYYAFTILTTVGFGDISASSPSEMVITVAIMLCGAYIFAIVLGMVGQIIMEGNAAKIDYDSMHAKTMHFCTHRGIKKPLRRQIDQFFLLAFPDKIMFDESEVLSQLPPMLRTEVMLDMYEDVMNCLPFLPSAESPKHCGDKSWDNDLLDIRIAICETLATTFYLAGECIFEEGQRGDEMYVVIKGQVEVLARPKDLDVGGVKDTGMQRVSLGGKNMFFGGIAAMTDERRATTCRAHTFVDCAVLTYDGMEHMMIGFPKFKTVVEEWVDNHKAHFDLNGHTSPHATAKGEEAEAEAEADQIFPEEISMKGDTDTEKIMDALQQMNLQMRWLRGNQRRLEDKIDDVPYHSLKVMRKVGHL